MTKIDGSLVAHLPLFAGFSAADLDTILSEARSAVSPASCSGLISKRSCDRSIIFLDAPTSAWRMARDAQTSLMMPTLTSTR